MADESNFVKIRLGQNEHGVFNEVPFSYKMGQEVDVHPDLAKELARLDKATILTAQKETATPKQKPETR